MGKWTRRKAATYTGQHKHRIKADKSMPWVGFKPIIPALDGAKAVHALDSAATVMGGLYIIEHYFLISFILYDESSYIKL
jgi:hypothetical protein